MGLLRPLASLKLGVLLAMTLKLKIIKLEIV